MTDSPADDAVDTSADEITRTANLPRRRLALLAVAILLAVCCIDGWMLLRQHRRQADSAAALSAATSFALVLTSIDSTTIDRDFAAVLDGSTGEFKDLYLGASEQLRTLMLQSGAGAHGTVVDAAVESLSPGHAEVLMFIDQSVHNNKVKGPQLDRSRVLVTMKKVDGRWLAEKVDPA